jgi:hypothetical protein
MQAAVTEEWEAIPQEWINELILKQEHWVHVLIERHGWSTPNYMLRIYIVLVKCALNAQTYASRFVN